MRSSSYTDFTEMREFAKKFNTPRTLETLYDILRENNNKDDLLEFFSLCHHFVNDAIHRPQKALNDSDKLGAVIFLIQNNEYLSSEIHKEMLSEISEYIFYSAPNMDHESIPLMVTQGYFFFLHLEEQLKSDKELAQMCPVLASNLHFITGELAYIITDGVLVYNE